MEPAMFVAVASARYQAAAFPEPAVSASMKGPQIRDPEVPEPSPQRKKHLSSPSPQSAKRTREGLRSVLSARSSSAAVSGLVLKWVVESASVVALVLELASVSAKVLGSASVSTSAMQLAMTISVPVQFVSQVWKISSAQELRLAFQLIPAPASCLLYLRWRTWPAVSFFPVLERLVPRIFRGPFCHYNC